MIELSDVTLSYGEIDVLQGIDLSLGADCDVVALLGRNGAGKSTLLSLLAGMTRQAAGSVSLDGTVLGADRSRLRRNGTWLPQDLRLDPQVSALAFVKHLLGLRGLPADDAAELFEFFGLGWAVRRPLGSMSGGERQRVALVYAFAADSPLVLLDEPTQALDPWERLRFAELLAERAARRTVMYATHFIADVEATASRVVVLHDAGIAFDGPVHALSATAPDVYVCEGDEKIMAHIADVAQVTGLARLGPDRYRARFATKCPPDEATRVEPTLTDAYLVLTSGLDR
ncbi:ABC transporter ATP-binding protein [Catellatospora sp. KI3]|uniref:ABC transporter ATP-binding protein n=1 Tax=Catellatospora sp. KI3 TaxID=3041620 RepID=UPI00248251E3|nr:ABC transporter ATP-binding protein [Catellatospora sp. KI3]MDI1459683.1 ABC transporter ATP-binding protein [Catellatospora sp. KI3]